MAEDYAENLFQAVDTIVNERVKNLPYDRTIRAKIYNNSQAYYGLYQVTTNDVDYFNAYSNDMSYNIGDEVYVRIPKAEYTEQKVIIGKYIPEVTINQTPTGGQVFYEATLGNIPFVNYDKQDGKNGYLVNDTVRLDSYQLLLYSNPNISRTYSPDETTNKIYEVQVILVHYISVNGILYADEKIAISNCFYGIDDGTTAGLLYNKILDGQYIINTLNNNDGKFTINFIPTHQIIHPYTIARAYVILSSGAIVVSDPIIFNADEQLSSKYRSFLLNVSNDQFFNYNAKGKFIGTDNLNCNIEIIYDNILDNSAIFDNNDTISIFGLYFLQQNGIVEFNGKKANISLSVDKNKILETSFHVEHLVFNITKDDVSYSISKDFYFGYKQIDADEQTDTINLYLNGNDVLKYQKLLVGNDGSFINISSTGVTLGGKALTEGNWAGNATTATTAINLTDKPSFTANNNNNITITAGGKTSDEFTVPFATNATNATNAINATNAEKLTTNAGTANKPVYFANGIPVETNTIKLLNTSNNSYDIVTTLNKIILALNTNIAVKNGRTDIWQDIDI